VITEAIAANATRAGFPGVREPSEDRE
jgi:hypothetical protein